MTDTNADPSLGLPPPESQRSAVWAQFRKHRGAMFGLVVLLVLVVFSLLGPFVWQPEKLSVAEALRSKNLAPSLAHPMGTDHLGRDQMQRMMLAGRVSLAVGFVAMLIAVILGTLVGVLAGYFRRLDGPLMRLTDMFLALPLIPLLLVMVMLFRDRIAGQVGPELGAFLLIVSAIFVSARMAR